MSFPPRLVEPNLPRLVLDTNVVLDLFFFRDPKCDALAGALAAGHVAWLASDEMQAELEHVLERSLRGTGRGDAASVRDAWRRWVQRVEPEPVPMPMSSTLRCTDGDDQKFIDLALQVRAQALLSADRAVLRLARRAAAQGLCIATARDWRPPLPGDARAVAA